MAFVNIILTASFIWILNCDAVRVDVKQGTLEGSVEQLVTGDGTYYSFKGVPYAKPPLGELRFKAPVDPLPWKGVRNATEHGSICLQYNYRSSTPPTFGSEDCLFLNVYTTNLNPDKPRSVMVYYHGGGYALGSGNVDNYGPDFLVQKDVIVVTVNYRLDALGFLCLDTKDVPGNAGLKDQVAALKWVKQNIAAFGGDPNCVTIFGQSSGGATVALHMLSPLASGLFKSGIAMSSSALTPWTIPFQPQRRAFQLGKLLGLDTESTTTLLAFLQSQPAENIVGLQPNVLVVEKTLRSVGKMYYWTNVVEKDFGLNNQYLTDDPLNLLKKGNINKADFMIGHTDFESLADYSSFLVSRGAATFGQYPEIFNSQRVIHKVSPKQQLALSDQIIAQYFGNQTVNGNSVLQLLNYFKDFRYFYDTKKYLDLLVNVKRNATANTRYFYQFSAVTSRNLNGVSARNSLNLTSGAAHGDDILHLFDPKKLNLTITKDSVEYGVVQKLCTLFTNFAKFGNPTPRDNSTSTLASVTWPQYQSYAPNYLDIRTTTLTPGTGLDSNLTKFYDSIYQQAGINY